MPQDENRNVQNSDQTGFSPPREHLKKPKQDGGGDKENIRMVRYWDGYVNKYSPVKLNIASDEEQKMTQEYKYNKLM